MTPSTLPGTGGARPRSLGLSRRLLVALTVLLGVVSSSPALAGSPRHPAASVDNTYGALPSWLPKSKIPVDRIVVASARDPKLGIEGDTIKALLPYGRTLITIAGPLMPPFVTPPPPTTTATFVISLSRTSGIVPVGASTFELVDGAGRFYFPHRFSGDQPARTAPDGRTVSFRITEVMATGSGSIRWSPDGTPVATWDFTVEND